MAQIQLQSDANKRRQRTAKVSLKIDMTPLVDLGFLLITFFIFTTTMSEPMATKLYMPADGTNTEVGESNAITTLLGSDNKVHYYNGKWEDAVKTNSIYSTSYDLQHGIGKIIREKQKALGTRRNELILMIKPLEHSSYKNFIDAMDEVMINNLRRYVIMDPSSSEEAYFTKNDNSNDL